MESGESASPEKQSFGEFRVSPNSGSGNDRVFRVSILHNPDIRNTAFVGLLINEQEDGTNACYVFRNVTNGESTLVTDSGFGSTSLGSMQSVGNRQCELLRDGTTSSADASGITVDFHVRFRRTFGGMKRLYVIVRDAQDRGSQLKPAGEWVVD
jgi:hypothetical protein